MNNCTFIGNLTADAQAKQSNINGTITAFITFDIAVNRKTRNGDETLYISCIKNGDNANLLPYLAKGKKVAVNGRVSTHAYLDRSGQPRASLDLAVYDLELLGGNASAEPQQAQPQPGDKTAQIFPERVPSTGSTSLHQQQEEQSLPF